MSLGSPVPLAIALRVANAIVDELAPTCERIEIAGSIRRRCPLVSDIEIVAQPRLAADLFGEVDPDIRTALELQVDALIKAGRLAPRLTSAGTERRGRKYQALVAVRARIAVDLFCVTPPATFGATLAIRTGPADYSARLVTKLRTRGLRCHGSRVLFLDCEPEYGRSCATCAGGGSCALDTETERHFFAACGEPWAEPEERR